jgi:hypothetical protein
MSAWGLLLGVLALALVDVLVVLGWTADSRDPSYGLGPVMRPRPTPAAPTRPQREDVP